MPALRTTGRLAFANLSHRLPLRDCDTRWFQRLPRGKRFYFKWYESRPRSAQRHCPRTVALLRNVPCVKATLFAELPVRAKFHAGQYRRRFKRWNPTIYKLTRAAMMVAIVAGIVWI